MNKTSLSSFTRFQRFTAGFLILAFAVMTVVCPDPVWAQSASLPTPGTMVSISPTYNPVLIQGLTFYPEQPMRFDFIVDPGDDQLQGDALRQETQRMIRYFLASLTVPEDEMWVNLSPYEDDRIIADGISRTELGRDLLAQDYLLKQLTASLMHPEGEVGQKFWQDVYRQAQQEYGTSDIPVDTFNKVWIVPETANVFVKDRNVFVQERYFKVLLEEDYVALDQHSALSKAQSPDMTEIAKTVLRDVMIPALEKEVNSGQHFAPLRQMFNAMILATWYKKTLKTSLLTKAYANQNKVQGIDVSDPAAKNKIYNQYIQAFQKGVYDYIQEERDEVTQAVRLRKYFSGGIAAKNLNVGQAGSAIGLAGSGQHVLFSTEFSSSPAAGMSGRSGEALTRTKIQGSEDVSGNPEQGVVSSSVLISDKIPEFRSVTEYKEVVESKNKVLKRMRALFDANENEVLKLLGINDISLIDEISYRVQSLETRSSGVILKIQVETSMGQQEGFLSFLHSEDVAKAEWKREPSELEFEFFTKASNIGVAPPSVVLEEGPDKVMFSLAVPRAKQLDLFLEGFDEENLNAKIELIIKQIGRQYGRLNKEVDVLHGDVSADHIFIGENLSVYLLDFGTDPYGKGVVSQRRSLGAKSIDYDLVKLKKMFQDLARDFPKLDLQNADKWLEEGYNEIPEVGSSALNGGVAVPFEKGGESSSVLLSDKFPSYDYESDSIQAVLDRIKNLFDGNVSGVLEFLGLESQKQIKDIQYEIIREEGVSFGAILKFTIISDKGRSVFYAKPRHSLDVSSSENTRQPFNLEFELTLEAAEAGISPSSKVLTSEDGVDALLLISEMPESISFLDLVLAPPLLNTDWDMFFNENKRYFITEIGRQYGRLNKQNKIGHGDIKLEHIILTRDKKVFLIDFGVVQRGTDSFSTRLTKLRDVDLKRLKEEFQRFSSDIVSFTNLSEEDVLAWLEEGYNEIPEVGSSALNGGIDLNAQNMNLNIQGDRILDFQLPEIDAQQLNILGLVPVIINVTPIDVLPLLGLSADTSPQDVAFHRS